MAPPLLSVFVWDSLGVGRLQQDRARKAWEPTRYANRDSGGRDKGGRLQEIGECVPLTWPDAPSPD